MHFGDGKRCSKLFHFLCIFATIGLVSWCYFEYSLDHDFTEIKFRKFHEKTDDIYPSITICDSSPFESPPAKERYASHTKNMLISSLPTQVYVMLLYGDKKTLMDSNLPNNTYEELLLGLHEIDYDEVTTRLGDIVSKFYITIPIHSEDVRRLYYHVSSDDNLILNETDVEKWEDFTYWRKRLFGFKSITPYISSRQPFSKCYTLDVPMIEKVQIREISITLNTSIFAYGLSPSQFYFYLTYPNQFLSTPLGNRIALPVKHAQCYKFEIHLGPIKVLRRRNKKQERCNDDWRDHDRKHLKAVFEKIGCNPKHWNIPSHLPNCSTPQQYTDFRAELYENDEIFMPPCRSIARLTKEKVGTTPSWFVCSESWLKLKVYLDEQSYYEELILLPAYSFQSLIGNAGRDTPISYPQSATKPLNKYNGI